MSFHNEINCSGHWVGILRHCLRRRSIKQNVDDPTFFEQIEQVKWSWHHQTLVFPVFYYEVTTLACQFLAPLEQVQRILPSQRMHPLRITPWHCVVNISAFEYHQSDIGPYNELSVGVPIVLDRPSPLFVGTLSPVPTVPQVYIHQLPVTTEIARDAGIELYGFPKFLADIAFEREGPLVRCRLEKDGQSILTLTGREGQLKKTPRSRIHPFTVRTNHMLRCEIIVSERQQVTGRGTSDVRLELGEHPMAQELADWKLGPVLGYQYAPHHQVILTQALESFAAC